LRQPIKLLQAKDSSSILLGEFEDLPAAACNTSQRIIGDQYRQPGLFHNQFINVAKQRTSTREHDAALPHITAEIRGIASEEKKRSGAGPEGHPALRRYSRSPVGD